MSISVRAPLETRMFNESNQMSRAWQEFFGTLGNKLNYALRHLEVEVDAEIADLNITGTLSMDGVTLIDEDRSLVDVKDIEAETLGLSGNAAIGGSLAVTGDVSGAGITGDSLDVAGEVAGATTDISGVASVGSLSSAGAIAGTAITGDSLDVTGEVEGATLNITSDGTIGGTLAIASDTTVKGADDTDAIFNLWADKGDNNADQWRIRASKTANALYVETYVSGAWVAKFTIDSSGDITVANDIILPADNDKIYIGGGKDASIYYDGTDLHLKTSEVAASDLKLTTGAAKTLELQTVVWDDLRVPLENTKLTPTKSEPEFAAFIDGTYLYGFKATNAADESLHFVAQIPHGYKFGTDLYPHIHWCPSNTDTGDVEWELEYLIANQDVAFGATAATLSETVAAPGTAFQHTRTYFDAIPGSAITSLSTMLICRLTRRADLVTDTFTGTAWALEFDFHYSIDTIGSRQATVK
jgi:hypothetical protein